MEERMSRMITYCFVDGQGDEQVQHISDEKGGKVGYKVDELTARVWIEGENGTETRVYPLSRIVFIREVSQ
jgi:hypothetical protein